MSRHQPPSGEAASVADTTVADRYWLVTVGIKRRVFVEFNWAPENYWPPDFACVARLLQGYRGL